MLGTMTPPLTPIYLTTASWLLLLLQVVSCVFSGSETKYGTYSIQNGNNFPQRLKQIVSELKPLEPNLAILLQNYKINYVTELGENKANLPIVTIFDNVLYESKETSYRQGRSRIEESFNSKESSTDNESSGSKENSSSKESSISNESSESKELPISKEKHSSQEITISNESGSSKDSSDSEDSSNIKETSTNNESSGSKENSNINETSNYSESSVSNENSLSKENFSSKEIHNSKESSSSKENSESKESPGSQENSDSEESRNSQESSNSKESSNSNGSSRSKENSSIKESSDSNEISVSQENMESKENSSSQESSNSNENSSSKYSSSSGERSQSNESNSSKESSGNKASSESKESSSSKEFSSSNESDKSSKSSISSKESSSSEENVFSSEINKVTKMPNHSISSAATSEVTTQKAAIETTAKKCLTISVELQNLIYELNFNLTDTEKQIYNITLALIECSKDSNKIQETIKLVENLSVLADKLHFIILELEGIKSPKIRNMLIYTDQSENKLTNRNDICGLDHHSNLEVTFEKLAKALVNCRINPLMSSVNNQLYCTSHLFMKSIKHVFQNIRSFSKEEREKYQESTVKMLLPNIGQTMQHIKKVAFEYKMRSKSLKDQLDVQALIKMETQAALNNRTRELRKRDNMC